MPRHRRVQRVFIHDLFGVVLDAEFCCILLQLLIELYHAEFECLSSLSFGVTLQDLYLFALVLVVILFAKHPVFNLVLLNENKLMGRKKFWHIFDRVA